VTGLVAPDKVIRNSTAQPGDALILTKPIGLGILTTALKQGLVGSEVEERLIRVMSRLNRAAAESMRKYTVHACTDVTGFGLLGHLHEMTQGSKVDARIALSSVPIIPEARDLAAMDVVPGGTLNNLAYVETHIDFDDKIDHVSRILLADAQTSGGLLISLPAGQAEELLTDLSAKGIEAARIGEMTGEGPGRISVVK
jgi:selenide,water dikinase